MDPNEIDEVVSLPLDESLWERTFTIAPLVVIGTREADGSYNLAPKHLATPLSWKNHFGFVCTTRHATYQNIKREGVFTVSYPRPNQMVITSLAASPRDEDGRKPSLSILPTFAAQQIDGYFIEDAYLFFECRMERIIDGFDINSLIAGEIVAAYAAPDALRQANLDDNDLLKNTPLLVYLNWGRFARISESYDFPFMSGFQR